MTKISELQAEIIRQRAETARLEAELAPLLSPVTVGQRLMVGKSEVEIVLIQPSRYHSLKHADIFYKKVLKSGKLHMLSQELMSWEYPK